MTPLFRSFLKDARGSTALIFGLGLPVLMLAVGGGIDYTQAAARRQKIASAIELSCREAALDIYKLSGQSGADPKKDYTPVANAKIRDAVNRLSQNGVSSVTVTSTLANNVITAVSTATSANSFGGILGYETLALRIERRCNYVLASTTPGTGGPNPGGPGTVLFVESWETGHNVASNSWTVLKNWNGWTTRNDQGGIEINGIPELAANTIRFGNFFAELDSHCYTSGCRTNSSMWREFGTSTNPLETGNYELSYWYISRERNPAYAGLTLCAKSTDGKKEWDAIKADRWRDQTNRIEVFFQQKKSGSYTTPPRDVDKATDQVDVCVHTDTWTERKIPLKVTTKGTYRIFFQAAGREDTYGGLIDYIRFCSGTCP